MKIEFEPLRSLIYINVAKEDYRHKLQNWLYRTHVPESIAQFEPYVTKYAFYSALPVPPDGKRFGTYNFQLTEHHWLLNPMNPILNIKSVYETVTPNELRWQGIIPDTEDSTMELDADAVRIASGTDSLPPFIFAFVPMWWEEDLKGAGRTISDGDNYRWQFVIRYPEGVSAEEGDDWLMHQVLPVFVQMDEVTRILSSKIRQDINDCPFHRVVEIWTDCPSQWHKAAVENTGSIPKPEWATADVFPYLKPKFEFASIFLGDVPISNNLQQYRGFMPMR